MDCQTPGTTIRMSHKAIHISPFISQSRELQAHLKYQLSTHLKVHQPIILQFMLFDTNQPFILLTYGTKKTMKWRFDKPYCGP